MRKRISLSKRDIDDISKNIYDAICAKRDKITKKLNEKERRQGLEERRKDIARMTKSLKNLTRYELANLTYMRGDESLKDFVSRSVGNPSRKKINFVELSEDSLRAEVGVQALDWKSCDNLPPFRAWFIKLKNDMIDKYIKVNPES